MDEAGPRYTGDFDELNVHASDFDACGVEVRRECRVRCERGPEPLDVHPSLLCLALGQVEGKGRLVVAVGRPRVLPQSVS